MSKLILTKSRVDNKYIVKTIYKIYPPDIHGEFDLEQDALDCYEEQLDYHKNGREVVLKEQELT